MKKVWQTGFQIRFIPATVNINETPSHQPSPETWKKSGCRRFRNIQSWSNRWRANRKRIMRKPSDFWMKTWREEPDEQQRAKTDWCRCWWLRNWRPRFPPSMITTQKIRPWNNSLLRWKNGSNKTWSLNGQLVRLGKFESSSVVRQQSGNSKLLHWTGALRFSRLASGWRRSWVDFADLGILKVPDRDFQSVYHQPLTLGSSFMVQFQWLPRAWSAVVRVGGSSLCRMSFGTGGTFRAVGVCPEFQGKQPLLAIVPRMNHWREGIPRCAVRKPRYSGRWKKRRRRWFAFAEYPQQGSWLILVVSRIYDLHEWRIICGAEGSQHSR